ncbi:hypothetical protein [Paenibacillus sp. L3-i20]|uniref:hypothetical protein n=1 Tax=Paenibacillus sp. L3-i20 TaxID=2905833 RepID=UPI001EE0AEBF|nr:hypothetical protein [Paenibacillus sp. L3-i20]GKU77985.1 hypothetical protein L3i20_v223820 [Paenibacillus sp. L3-i20]
MVQDWATRLLLAFGIVVAIIGVIAYLRLFRKEKPPVAPHSRTDATPPLKHSSSINAEDHKGEQAPEDESTKN